MLAYENTNAPLLVSDRYYDDPVRGLRRVQVYEGTPAQINSITVDPLASWETDDGNAPAIRLTINSPDLSDLRTTFEISGQDLSRSVYERQIFPTTDADQNKIKAWFRGNQADGTFAPLLTSLSNDNARSLAYLLFKKTENWYDSGYVLRQKSVGLANVGYPSLVIGPKGTGCLFTPADLDTGGHWDLGFDTTTRQFLAAIRPQTKTQGDPYNNYLWTWLCGQCSQTDLPGGKKEFRQEFKLALWANTLYNTWGQAGLTPPHLLELKAPPPEPNPKYFPLTKPVLVADAPK
jgi:hypothetical protein